jgi:hypothetical protein
MNKTLSVGRLVEKAGTVAAAAAIYLPVLAGIITPMLWLLPAWYSTWYVLGFIFPFSDTWGGLWVPFLDGDLPPLLLPIFVIETTVFFIGSYIFLRSLLQLVRSRLRGEWLTSTGFYARVRHPQHLGIILALLPLALFNYHNHYYFSGIRSGDLLSWSFVTFLLLVVSEIEELGMLKRLGAEYKAYLLSTPFILPGLPRIRILSASPHLNKGKPLRYLALFAVYWCIMSLVLYGFTLLPLQWTL